MRKLSVLLAGIATLAIPAFAAAPLPPGTVLYNPALNGTGEIGSTGPFYTGSLPSWVNAGNLEHSLVGNIAGIPGFSQFHGTVESWCYRLDNGNIGLVYRINLAQNSAPRLVRASIAPDGWVGTGILDAGADGSGSSTAATGNTTWGDGDPYFIERDALGLAPSWVFRLGNDGTVLNPGDNSALVFFETDAPDCGEGTISLLDGGAAGAAMILTVVPSPAAAGLGLLGLSIIGGLRRRLA
jgi:hypothetical protein